MPPELYDSIDLFTLVKLVGRRRITLVYTGPGVAVTMSILSFLEPRPGRAAHQKTKHEKPLTESESETPVTASTSVIYQKDYLNVVATP